jgi:hypothetical protein
MVNQLVSLMNFDNQNCNGLDYLAFEAWTFEAERQPEENRPYESQINLNRAKSYNQGQRLWCISTKTCMFNNFMEVI